MKLSAELTMYPFNDDYIPLIQNFIEKLNTYSGITIQTFPTATIVTGDYDRVMDIIKEMLRWSHEKQGKAVFVAKFIPGKEVISSSV